MPLRHCPLGLILSALAMAPAPCLAQDFIRGDANRDGKVSVSDGITIRRHIFAGAWFPPCRDAADANDDGVLMLDDEIEILKRLIGPQASFWTMPLPAPYPAPGEDSTADDLDCSGPLAPAQESEDTVELGSVTASPGERVSIPIRITSSVDVEALQLVVRYDPSLISVASRLDLDGTYFDRFAADEKSNPVGIVTAHAEEGIFTVGLLGHVAYDGYAIEPGEDVLVAKIVATISASAPPRTVISLEPTNGEGGAGSGPNGALNELTHKGEARYLSILPRTLPGLIEVVAPDFLDFLRGDANSDGLIDIADPVRTLNRLFLDAPDLACPDAADSNDDGRIDISDPVLILQQLYGSSEPASIPPGFGICARDLVEDGLSPCAREGCPPG